MRLIIAVGGNSLIRSGQRGTMEEQWENINATARAIAELSAAGHEILITHGNGPQVGNLLLMSDKTAELPELPLDYWGANTQGGIGYQLQSAVHAELRRRGQKRRVAAVVSRVEVRPDDPAFDEPTKPVGPFFDRATAERYAAENDWVVREDAGRGWRRVVPSPRPVSFVELSVVRSLLETGVVTIAVGGGGIPVVANADGTYRGVEAVIDKDRASCLTARLLEADMLVISTDVANVMLDYGTPQARPLERVGVAELAAYTEAGHFAPGSMGPKIEAALEFIEAGGSAVVITDPGHLVAAVSGAGGTFITA
jgi:carbamate kinase